MHEKWEGGSNALCILIIYVLIHPSCCCVSVCVSTCEDRAYLDGNHPKSTMVLT